MVYAELHAALNNQSFANQIQTSDYKHLIFIMVYNCLILYFCQVAFNFCSWKLLTKVYKQMEITNCASLSYSWPTVLLSPALLWATNCWLSLSGVLLFKEVLGKLITCIGLILKVEMDTGVLSSLYSQIHQKVILNIRWSIARSAFKISDGEITTCAVSPSCL